MNVSNVSMKYVIGTLVRRNVLYTTDQQLKWWPSQSYPSISSLGVTYSFELPGIRPVWSV